MLQLISIQLMARLLSQICGRGLFFYTFLPLRRRKEKTMSFYSKTVEQTMAELSTDKNGLSAEKAAENRKIYGENKISEGKRKGIIRVFFEQFFDLLVAILIISAIISVFTGNGESAVVIICVIVLNAILGTVQHFKAEKSLDALKSMSSPTAKVFRDGTLHVISASEITVGDIVSVEQGDIIPADGRVIHSASLSVNESSLTGESNSIEKITDALGDKEISLADRKNMVYTGSLVTGGRGSLAVTATGMNTELGKIAGLINTAQRKKTPLQKSLDKFSKQLSIVIPLLCAVVMLLYIMRGIPFADSLMFAVALAVAAIPEALSSIVTIALAIGTSRMAQQNAVIKDLKAVEGLGCVSVICSDKTGTLTQNKMTVREIFTLADNDEGTAYLKNAMALCNDSEYTDSGVLGDPTETALSDYIGQEEYMRIRRENPRVSEIPFDSDRKLMSTFHRNDSGYIMYTKGAADNLCRTLTSVLDGNTVRECTAADRQLIAETTDGFSEKGMRVLGFAYKLTDECKPDSTAENDFVFIGLAAMTDPPRAESCAAVRDCISAGIKPVMITGDHKTTACAIARETGIMQDGDICLDGMELDKLSDSELSDVLENVSVYARVSPVHKIRIVEQWQNKGKIVAMTGDGVNDAPALKKADIGVAMGITGTQVSKDAASMILTDDNFATIIKSVANGRAIYSNITNAIKFLLSGNLAGIMAVLYTAIPGLPAPFTAVQLLFINLLTDSLPAIAISMEEADKSLLKQKPRDSKAAFLTKPLTVQLIISGVLIAIATVLGYHAGLAVSAAKACGMAFSTLCLARLFHGFNCRSDKSVFKAGILKNKFSLIAFAAGVILLCCALFIPGVNNLFGADMLSPADFGVAAGLAFVPTAIIQIYRVIKEHIKKK